jgi:predicted nuclease of predicted toxin-antitoxin system
VKFLLDAQLPRRLAPELDAIGHESIHTLDLPARNRIKDHEINSVASETVTTLS